MVENGLMQVRLTRTHATVVPGEPLLVELLGQLERKVGNMAMALMHLAALQGDVVLGYFYTILCLGALFTCPYKQCDRGRS